MATANDWLGPALAYVRDWLGFQMRQSEQVGCALAIAHKDRIVLDTAFGLANAKRGEALTRSHRFRVASHSKSFTAAAIMKLREQGKLKLDDTAGQYVRGLHPAIAGATVAQLLSHTAGIFRDGEDSPYWVGRGPFSDEATLRRDLKKAPVIDANARLKYSNHGFGLAGLIIEAVAKEPYSQFVTRTVVRPAGLRHTTPDVPLPRGARLARGHSGKILTGRRAVFPGDQSTHALAAATGFVSTAADLVRFFGQLSPNAPTSFLSKSSRREMIRTQWHDPYAIVETGYGQGIATGRHGDWDWFGHSGGFQGYLTRTAVVPAQDIAVSLLMNAADAPTQVLLDGVLHILSHFQKAGPPTRRTRDWTGRWWSVWGAADLVPMGDKVMLAVPGFATPFLKASELAITGRDRGRIEQASAFGNFGEPAALVRGRNGAVQEVRIGSGRLVKETALKTEVAKRYGR